jgi:hypothetical protein
MKKYTELSAVCGGIDHVMLIIDAYTTDDEILEYAEPISNNLYWSESQVINYLKAERDETRLKGGVHTSYWGISRHHSQWAQKFPA